jgi:hypothetical protein
MRYLVLTVALVSAALVQHPSLWVIAAIYAALAYSFLWPSVQAHPAVRTRRAVQRESWMSAEGWTTALRAAVEDPHAEQASARDARSLVVYASAALIGLVSALIWGGTATDYLARLGPVWAGMPITSSASSDQAWAQWILGRVLAFAAGALCGVVSSIAFSLAVGHFSSNSQRKA